MKKNYQQPKVQEVALVTEQQIMESSHIPGGGTDNLETKHKNLESSNLWDE